MSTFTVTIKREVTITTENKETLEKYEALALLEHGNVKLVEQDITIRKVD